MLLPPYCYVTNTCCTLYYYSINAICSHADLVALASHTNPSPPTLPHQLSVITTPLNCNAWELWLNYHPDTAYTNYILDSITSSALISAVGSPMPTTHVHLLSATTPQPTSTLP